VVWLDIEWDTACGGVANECEMAGCFEAVLGDGWAADV